MTLTARWAKARPSRFIFRGWTSRRKPRADRSRPGRCRAGRKPCWSWKMSHPCGIWLRVCWKRKATRCCARTTARMRCTWRVSIKRITDSFGGHRCHHAADGRQGDGGVAERQPIPTSKSCSLPATRMMPLPNMACWSRASRFCQNLIPRRSSPAKCAPCWIMNLTPAFFGN